MPTSPSFPRAEPATRAARPTSRTRRRGIVAGRTATLAALLIVGPVSAAVAQPPLAPLPTRPVAPAPAVPSAGPGATGRPVAPLPAGIPRAPATAGGPDLDLDPRQTPADPAAVADARALSRAFRGAAAQVSPAVVTVVGRIDVARRGGTDRFGRPTLRDLQPIDPRAEEEPAEDDLVEASVGSGVLISPDGYVLTNNHVVGGAAEVRVRLEDGREFVAADVKADRLSDVAVVKIDANGQLPYARLGDSDALEIGDWVLAIGHPFELDLTVSAGIISGKGRSISKIRRGTLLQTDAAINPGNSGGPLVNLDGQVIGLNTAIASSNGGSQGVGFAIPSNRAAWVVKELLTHQKVRRSYLGIYIDEVDAAVAGRYGLPVRGGVLVTGTREGGPAARAGFVAGDLITSFAGKPVRVPQELQDAVEQYPVGSVQTMQYYRDGRPYSASVTLDELPPGPGDR